MLARLWHAFDRRTGLADAVKRVAYRPVPPGTGWSYVLGTATLVALVAQVVTGTVLAMIYVPTPQHAFDSLQFITREAAFGRLVRGMHYFGASALIVLVGLHTLRVYLTGSYKFPREVSWLSGVLLLGLTVFMGFTGQLLRWDQHAIWSTLIAAEQAGRTPLVGTALAHFILAGDTIGGATLTRFFAAHVLLFPGLILLLTAFHLYLVVRHGVSEPPRLNHAVDPATYQEHYRHLLKHEGRPYWPDVAWRDAVTGAALLTVILALAWFVGPPEVTAPPDPTAVQVIPKPDWYFLWYYAFLTVIPDWAEAYAIVLVPLLVFLGLFIVPFVSNTGERRPLQRPVALGVTAFIVGFVGALTYLATQAPWTPAFDAEPLPVSVIGTTDGPVFRGARLFDQRGCLSCHQVAGHGGSVGPDFTEVDPRMTAERLTIIILRGRKDMPAYGSILEPAEVEDIVAFLLSRQPYEGSTEPIRPGR